MICPHCGKEIIVSLTAPEKDIQLRWEEHAQGLRDEWKGLHRFTYNDDRNLDWLDGRHALLKEIGINKYIALRFLKQGMPTGE